VRTGGKITFGVPAESVSRKGEFIIACCRDAEFAMCRPIWSLLLMGCGCEAKTKAAFRVFQNESMAASVRLEVELHSMSIPRDLGSWLA
jgi:hypothetical protein